MLKPTHSVGELSEQSVTGLTWQKEQQEEATLHTTITLTAIPTHPQHAVTAVRLQAVRHQAVRQAAVAVAQASEDHVAVAAVISEAEDKFEIKKLRN